MAAVVLDSAGAEGNAGGDFHIGVILGGQSQHLVLAGREGFTDIEQSSLRL